ncbi:MAG: IS200/IS605 family transposase [Desulfotignum sp.]|jgi:putative transposase|nr:IS200/IS605 family transposase [Desulfotignum sp.]
MNITYKTNNNICYSCKYHVVWCPKYRKKILKGNIEKRLKQIVKDVCNEKQSDLIEIECDKDHIHILVEVDPQYGIHRLIKQIKGVSSKKLREEFPVLKKTLPTLWTNSYFVSTIGGAPSSVIKQYIENQKTRYEEIKLKGWKNNGRT